MLKFHRLSLLPGDHVEGCLKHVPDKLGWLEGPFGLVALELPSYSGTHTLDCMGRSFGGPPTQHPCSLGRERGWWQGEVTGLSLGAGD